MKKNSIILFLIFAFILMICGSFCSTNQSYAEINDSVLTSAKSMCLMETNSKRVLYEKNMSDKRAIASTTKIITALTVLSNVDDLSKNVEITKQMTNVSGTRLYFEEGEKYTIRELLYGLMLISGNDCAVALAIEVGGSIPAFAQMMNKTATLCGAKNSHFINPHGLDEFGHESTAYDLACISSYALNNPTFVEICSCKQIKISSKNNGMRTLKNKNKLLSSLDGCIGVKTGFTDDAGRCLVSACERDGMQVVCVVLSCGPMFEESELLLNKAFAEFKKYELLSPYSVIKKIRVENGESDYVKVYTAKGFEYPLTFEEYMKIDYQYFMPEKLIAPISKEKIIGKVEIKLENDLLFSENIYTMEEVKSFAVSEGFSDIIDKWLRG